MMTTRVYRRARPVSQALEELRNLAGEQFCPRCVAALERILPLDSLPADEPRARELLAM
jgi:HD-GYP domain-containing protein (c-di-GMP phosphodiesterase class II)